MYYDLKTPAVITLDSCDIKPVSLLNIQQKTKVLTNPLIVLFDTVEWHMCTRAESSHLMRIQRQPDTFYSTPNGAFFSNK